MKRIIKNEPRWYTDFMNKTTMTYFQQEDILHIVITEEHEAGSVELSPNITAELNEHGELIGIEILKASTFIRDAILETVQAKLLNLPDLARLQSLS